MLARFRRYSEEIRVHVVGFVLVPRVGCNIALESRRIPRVRDGIREHKSRWEPGRVEIFLGFLGLDRNNDVVFLELECVQKGIALYDGFITVDPSFDLRVLSIGVWSTITEYSRFDIAEGNGCV